MIIQDFTSKKVFLSTSPLIYFIEGHTGYQPIHSRLFDFNDEGGFLFVSSTLTLFEVLVKPLRTGQKPVAEKYKSILTTAPVIELIGFEILSPCGPSG